MGSEDRLILVEHEGRNNRTGQSFFDARMLGAAYHQVKRHWALKLRRPPPSPQLPEQPALNH